MRPYKLLYLFLLLFLAAGCREEFETITTTETPDNYPFIVVNATVRGIVMTVEGRLEEGITVTAPGLGSTITDADGRFSFPTTEVNGNGLPLTFSRNGRVLEQRLITPAANGVYYETIEIPSLSGLFFPASSGGTFALDNGAAVVVPPNAAIVNGSPYSGDIHARIIYYDPTSQNEMLQSPGNFLGVLNNEDVSLSLESYGMMQLSLQTPAPRVKRLLLIVISPPSSFFHSTMKWQPWQRKPLVPGSIEQKPVSRTIT